MDRTLSSRVFVCQQSNLSTARNLGPLFVLRTNLGPAPWGEEGNAAYYDVAPRSRLAVAGVYVGLIAALAVGMDATFVERTLGDA